MARVVIREGNANDRLKRAWRGSLSEGEGKRSTETWMARVVIRKGKANDRLKRGWRGLSLERGRQTIDLNGDGESCHQRGEGKRSTKTGMARVVIREGKANDRLQRGWRELSSEGGRQTID